MASLRWRPAATHSHAGSVSLMFLPRPGSGFHAQAVRWAVLLSASVAISIAFEMARLPAALLLGPMLAAILLGVNGRAVAMPRSAFMMAQGVVGTMMARAMPPTVLGEIVSVWPVILFGVASVVVTANVIGYVLARFRVLPGTTAVWGASPGAATAMVIMAEAYGGDTRLVAVMQYLRVLIVATMASLAARSLSRHDAYRWYGGRLVSVGSLGELRRHSGGHRRRARPVARLQADDRRHDPADAVRHRPAGHRPAHRRVAAGAARDYPMRSAVGRSEAASTGRSSPTRQERCRPFFWPS